MRIALFVFLLIECLSYINSAIAINKLKGMEDLLQLKLWLYGQVQDNL